MALDGECRLCAYQMAGFWRFLHVCLQSNREHWSKKCKCFQFNKVVQKHEIGAQFCSIPVPILISTPTTILTPTTSLTLFFQWKNGKSIKIWRNYGQEFVASLFWPTLYIISCSALTKRSNVVVYGCWNQVVVTASGDGYGARRLGNRLHSSGWQCTSQSTYSTACVLELRYLRSHLLRPRPTYFPSTGLLILLKKKSVEVMHAHELSVHSLHDLIGIFH